MIERLARQLGKEERDLRVFQAVAEHQPIGITKLAREVDVDEHKVRHSLRMLEGDGLIEPTPNGAIVAEDSLEQIEEINAGLDALKARMNDLKQQDS